ncbi:MAG: hypothetical protein AAF604_06630 [Acidobacteriota bacterium]
MKTRTAFCIAALTLVVLGLAAVTSNLTAAPAKPTPQHVENIIPAERVADLAAIQKRHARTIMALPGVQGFGVGLTADGKDAELQVLVRDDQLAPALEPFLDGAPVSVRYTGRIRLEDGFPGCVQPCHAEQQTLPVEMGNSAYSTMRCSACTLGFKACDATREKFVYVTNAHCNRDLNLNQAPIGTITRHVSRGDSPGCGFEEIVGEIGGHADPCDPANSTVDGSKVDSHFDLTWNEIRDIGSPSAFPGNPALGTIVQKSGRTTGRTFGRISMVNLTLNVPAGNFVCGPVTMDEQFMISPVSPSTIWSNNGDSGSAVLDNENRIVGLNFAGDGANGYANTIENVLLELDLTLNLFECTGDCPFAEAARGLPEDSTLLGLGYRFRDQVLPRTSHGRRYAELFEEHRFEMLKIMLTRPNLLQSTRAALDEHRGTLETLVERGRAVVSAQQVTELQSLLSSFAAAASQELRQDLETLRRDVADDDVQRAIGIVVQ